jgi:hypothetical protein
MVLDFAALPHQSRGSGEPHAGWNWAESPTRCGAVQNTSCFLKPLSSCTAADTRQAEPECCLCPRSRRLGNDDVFNVAVDAFQPPPHLRHRGSLWYKAVLVRWLASAVRTPPAREYQVETALQVLDWPTAEPVVGLHVRRGDACGTVPRGGHCRSLAAYEAEARRMADHLGARLVYVATDDTEAAAHFRAASSADLRFALLDDALMHRETLGAGRSMIEGRIASKEVDVGVATDGALLEWQLLGRTQGFVGAFSSNLARLSFELAVATNQRVIPYISVDSAWCPHWRMCCDVNAHGESDVC